MHTVIILGVLAHCSLIEIVAFGQRSSARSKSTVKLSSVPFRRSTVNKTTQHMFQNWRSMDKVWLYAGPQDPDVKLNLGLGPRRSSPQTTMTSTLCRSFRQLFRCGSLCGTSTVTASRTSSPSLDATPKIGPLEPRALDATHSPWLLSLA